MSEAARSNDDWALVQDYSRDWHVAVRAYGRGRWLTLCERMIAEREPVPLWDPAEEFWLNGDGLDTQIRLVELRDRAVGDGADGWLMCRQCRAARAVW